MAPTKHADPLDIFPKGETGRQKFGKLLEEYPAIARDCFDEWQSGAQEKKLSKLTMQAIMIQKACSEEYCRKATKNDNDYFTN